MTYLLAALSGVLVTLAYPSPGLWPLIVIAWAPLLVALQDQGWRARLTIGWVGGIVATVGVQYWLVGSVVRLTGVGWATSALAFAAYAVLIGGQWAVFSVGYGLLRRWSGRLGWLVTVPLFFVVLERVYPAVFPLFAGAALWESPVLLQSAEWFGVSFLSLLVFAGSCALAQVIEEFGRGRASDHFVPTALAGLWVMISMWGLVRMEQVWSAPVRGAPTIALVQPNVTVDEKRDTDPMVREAVYARTVQMTTDALAKRPDLVVWPEGGFPYVFHADVTAQPPASEESGAMAWSRVLDRFAFGLGVDFATGALRDNDGRLSNSAIFFPRGVSRPALYDKRELLLLGERLPLADTFPVLEEWIPGAAHYRPGTSGTVWQAAGFRVVPTICYEAIFPGFVREALVAGEGDILLNFTNDVWFGPTAEVPLHLMLQTIRAVENRTWLVRSTNSGISAFVDPTGTIRARTTQGEVAVLAFEMPVPMLGRSFYRRFGDAWLYVSVILSFLWVLRKNWPQLRNFRRQRVVSAPESTGADSPRGAP